MSERNSAVKDEMEAGVSLRRALRREPLVVLRYFGPEVNPDAPEIGAYRRNRF